MSRRWFKIAGQDEGDRSIEEQTIALRPALDETKGKTVLDLGCAEGLIAIAFAKAGASRVWAFDRVGEHLNIARGLGEGQPIDFVEWDLNEADAKKPIAADIVLCLGIIHKMTYPEKLLRFAAKSCRDLLLCRHGRAERNWEVKSKYNEQRVNIRKVLKQEGMVLEQRVPGIKPFLEEVSYWRRPK